MYVHIYILRIVWHGILATWLLHTHLGVAPQTPQTANDDEVNTILPI